MGETLMTNSIDSNAVKLIGMLRNRSYGTIPCISIETFEEAYALEVVSTAVRTLGAPYRTWSVIEGVRETDSDTEVPETQHPAGALYHLAREESLLRSTSRGAGVVCLLDLGDHLNDPRVLRGLRDLVAVMSRRGGSVVLIDHVGAGQDGTGIPDVVRAMSTPLELEPPAEDEIEALVRTTVQRVHKQSPVEVALTREDLQAIVRNLRGLQRREIEHVMVDLVADDSTLSPGDLPRLISKKRELVQSGGMLEYVDAPANLDQIGGMGRLKTWLAQRETALDDASVDTPRGVLLLGVQGAGKSLCAKAIATAWRRPLLRMDVGALYDKYIGQSERRLRETLRQAELMSPLILWIDEIEKAFASAASQSNDGGLSRRMFGTLLTWMQEHREPVFLVATANDIEALPPELLRKGRFDEIFFVDLPGAEARQRIFEIHLQKRHRNVESFDLAALTEASAGFSGAEIEQAIISAIHRARSEDRQPTTGDVVEVMSESPPLSVTMAERVQSLRSWAQGRCLMAE